MAQSEFSVNPALSAIAVGYSNQKLIADSVLPRVGVPTKTFLYTVYNKADPFTVQDSRVQRKSEPTQVDFGGVQVSASCLDYGFDDLIPVDEINQWESMPKPAGAVSPMAKSTSLLTNLLLLDREIRVANKVFNAASYAAGQSATLSGTSQWSDYTNSDPLDALMVAMDVPLFRPNKLVIGRAAWTKLRKHPKLVQAVYKNYQGAGVVSAKDLADELELDEIIIGDAWFNTAARGQNPTITRAWGKHAALLYIDPDMANVDQPQFGFTPVWGARVAGTIDEPKKGLRGGTTVRVGESVTEVISDGSCGYFFQNVVA
jgi:hypothetical protein